MSELGRAHEILEPVPCFSPEDLSAGRQRVPPRWLRATPTWWRGGLVLVDADVVDAVGGGGGDGVGGVAGEAEDEVHGAAGEGAGRASGAAVGAVSGAVGGRAVPVGAGLALESFEDVDLAGARPVLPVGPDRGPVCDLAAAGGRQPDASLDIAVREAELAVGRHLARRVRV